MHHNVSFSEQDFQFMRNRGSNPEEVVHQFSFFETGFSYANLQRPAILGDGIIQLREEEIERFISYYNSNRSNKKILKFVPASGAATRMFKMLFTFLESGKYSSEIERFRKELTQYAFYNDLKNCCHRLNYDIESPSTSNEIIIRCLLNEEGLNYGNLPKALIQFHNYQNFTRTSLEEHLVEAAQYAQNENHICEIHFTISPQHEPLFAAILKHIQVQYEELYHIKYHITTSIQDPATDTLAATTNNHPFRTNDGDLLFRPAGHGALINNLNRLEADIIFIKNIDNVISEEKLESTIIYKKALAGYLLFLEEKIFSFQKKCAESLVSKDELFEIQQFAEKELHIVFSQNQATQSELYTKLHRPIRVCGMVKNEGEPGGGPFWVKNSEGQISCQIVESSQVNSACSEQKLIAQKATHFNPVDMVCGITDYAGNKYDLKKFIDFSMGFISEKSYEGETLKAMELPGLWNGAMADWITLFIEVPLSTFNPVKTVFDLSKR